MDRFMAAQRRATRTKFDHMGRIALYYADPAAMNPRIIRVCPTDRFTTAGDQKGTSQNAAEVEIESPMIEFLLDEIMPKQGSFVALQQGLVYQIETLLPFDDITITGRAVRLRQEKLANYPVPSERLRIALQMNPSLLLEQPTPLPSWMKAGV